MPDYFGGAPTAVQGGMEFAAAQRRRKLHDNALNALIEHYGPVAADPTSYGQLEGIQQRAQMAPLDAAQAQQNLEIGQQTMDTTRAAHQTAAELTAARYLQATAKRGGDVGAAFDRISSILPQFGISPEQAAAMKQQFTADPKSIDDLVASLSAPAAGVAAPKINQTLPVRDKVTGEYGLMNIYTDGRHELIGGVEPANVELAQGRLDESTLNRLQRLYEQSLPSREPGVQTRIPGVDQTPVTQTTVAGSQAERELIDKDSKFLQSYAVISNHADVVQTNAERALGYFRGAGGGPLLQSLRSVTHHLPGMPSYDAWDALEGIKNNIAIDELQRMRQSSPTGGALGNVSDRDISLMTGALGRLEVERDPKRMVEDIDNIVSVYTQITNAARQDAEAAQARMQQRQSQTRSPTPGGTPSAVDLSGQSDEELLRILRGGQ